MKETFDNSQSFELGDLMPWHEMSRLLLVIQAELSDIKTRLDDLETAVGEMMPAIDLADFVPVDRPEETTGTHPPNCRCAWCEPQEDDELRDLPKTHPTDSYPTIREMGKWPL